MVDTLTELDNCLRGRDFTFNVADLACASAYLQELQAAPLSSVMSFDDEEDASLETAIAACESLYRHLNRIATQP